MDARPDETAAPTPMQGEADRLWHAGRFAEAARLYADAAARAPDATPLLPWQGHALRAAGEPEAALDAYARAAAEAPAEPPPPRHGGDALRRMGRAGEARSAYAMAVALEIGATAGEEAAAAIRAPDAAGPAVPEPPLPPASPVSDPPPVAEEVPAPPSLPEAEPEPEPLAPTRQATVLAPPPRPSIAMLRVGGGATAQVAPESRAAIAFDVSDLLLHFGGRRTLTGIQRVQASVLRAALDGSQDGTESWGQNLG